MSASSNASAKRSNREGQTFVAAATSAMRRAATKVAAENKRLGLPLIAEKSKGATSASKPRR